MNASDGSSAGSGARILWEDGERTFCRGLCRINAGEVKFEADENALATR